MTNNPGQNQQAGQGKELAKALGMKLLERALAPRPAQVQPTRPGSGYKEKRDRSDTSPKWGSHQKVDLPRGLGPKRTLTLRDAGGMSDISGESFYSHTIKYLLEYAADERGEIEVILLPEPHNPFDKNAVVVAAAYKSNYHVLGHIPAEVAASYSRALSPVVKKKYLPVATAVLHVNDYAWVKLRLGSAGSIIPASFKG